MAYLIDNPPRISQFAPRTRRPTGLVVLHTAEGVMDTIGPDTGAEATAEFIRNRTTYGSYHDLVDSDSVVSVVPYELAAYQDGTGSNGYALSISFACKTSDWRAMSPEKRRGFLRNGARAFARQQAWLKARGYPTTPLRIISKAESDAGQAGLIYHGWRDPARRTDPGISPPNLFPLAEFIEECRAELAGTVPTPSVPLPIGDDDMHFARTPDGTVWKVTDYDVTAEPGYYRYGALHKARGKPTVIDVTREELLDNKGDADERRARLLTDIAKAAGGDVDEAMVVAGLIPAITEALAGRTGATREEIAELLRGITLRAS